MLPPPGLQMAPDSTWLPSRKLVPLQKGSNPNEPFAVNILCREDKDYESYDATVSESSVGSSSTRHTTMSSQELSNPKLEEELTELKCINQELYKFSLKNILQQDL